MKPWFVAKPGNVDEVQGIVKWANQTQTPLVPVSSGPPRFHGDTVPCATGAVIVDLSGMNRIRRIDRKNRMILIEPGVTYSQLQPELAKVGLRLSTPLLPRANKSVIASLLERQPTLVPKYQWSMPEPLRCLEIVWGNGEILWTENGVWVWDIQPDYPRTAGILDSAIIGDGAGGAAVVWTGYGAPVGHKNSAIYAQRLSPDGQRLWPDEKVYSNPSFQSQGYASIVGDGKGGVIIGSRVGESSSVSKTDSVYAQKIDSHGNRMWGKGGLEIQKVSSALTVQFIAAGAILAAILVLVGVFRRNRIAGEPE